MERTVVVGILEGLHARPAALFVKEAARQPVPVRLTSAAGATADAVSILGVMTLGVAVGDKLVLTTETDGPDASASIDALATFLERDTVA